jgi:hypothetical protein
MGVMRLSDPEWWVRVGRFYGDVSEGDHYVVIDDDMGGSSHKTASKKFTGTQVWLKISKRGSKFDFYYHTGSRWTHLKTYTLSQFDDMYIYFTAFSWTNNSVVASFYDFTLSRR